MKDNSSCSTENKEFLEKLIITTKQNIFNMETDMHKKANIINEHNRKCRRVLINKPKNTNE